jgi:enediyne biosynthesis protein E4
MSRNPHVQEPEEEVSHLDDAVIGRAFRWSFVIVALLGIAVGVGIWISKRKPAPAAPRVTQLTAPSAATKAVAEIPQATFTAIELPFVHNNGAYGDKLLPETMGGGVAFLDFDNDSDQDLLLISGTCWPWKTDMPTATPALFRNKGKGEFEDVTAGSGLDVSIYGMGVAIGDYDNDGRVDVFISAVGENRLFHNEGRGKFREVPGVAGSPQEWSTACAMIDYDNDGDLDLYVGNYVRWSREIDLEVGYKLVGVGRAYGQPMNFEGTFPYLYRNDNGKFTEVAQQAGLHIKNPATGVPAAKTLGVAPIDLDNDGWIDLVVANDTVQNLIFHNQRNGTFKEIGAISGVAFDTYGNTRGAMGIDAARYRNDGAVGIVIGNFANEMTALYVSQGNSLVFSDEAIPEGIGPPSRLLLKFGVFFFDYDLDGRLDVLSANGHLEEEISKIQQSQRYHQPAQLFWNSGAQSGATFMSVPPEKAGQDFFKPIVGRGSAYADIDNDGDLDAILTQTGGRPLLVRNDQKLQHHWIRLKLVGTRNNRDAIGAWIHARVNGTTISRQVMPTRSYLSQSELPVTIGLGKNEKVESLEILWPGGHKQTVPSLNVDALTVIEEAR